MGRAKVKMELIEKEKSRNTTFKKRKEGLIRKVHEFTTLCDVSACIIIYGPNHSPNHPETWPSQNPAQVRRIIDVYKSKSSAAVKSYGVADFFHERKKQIQEEVAKLRRKNLQAKYPTLPELLNFMNESQIRQFHALLTEKAEAIRSRIELLRRNNRSDLEQQQQQEAAVEMIIDHHRLHQLNHHSSIMQFEDSSCNHKSIMQFEDSSSSSSSGNIQLNRELFFESSATGYYAPPPQLPYLLPPPYLSINQDELIQHQLRNLNLQDEELVLNRFFSG